MMKSVLSSSLGPHIQPPSIIDLPIAELRKKYRGELKGVELDQDRVAVDPFLEKIGQKVNEFFRNLPNTVSKEQIRQAKLHWDGMVADQISQDVHYLLILQPKGTRVEWEEARTDEKGNPVEIRRLDGESFLSSGFALACMLFSPPQLGASRFRYLGRQSEKPYSHLIAFAQRPETSIPGRFRTKAASVETLTQGIAWIDPESYQIIRIRSDLLEPLPGTGLTQLTSEISYAVHRFQSSPLSFRLPSEVVVTIKYRGKLYRNTHRYSHYQLFSVQTYEKREPVAPPGAF
jgi:hypothetical protein